MTKWIVPGDRSVWSWRCRAVLGYDLRRDLHGQTEISRYCGIVSGSEGTTFPGIRRGLRGEKERSGDHAGSPRRRVLHACMEEWNPEFPKGTSSRRRKDVFSLLEAAQGFLRMRIEFDHGRCPFLDGGM